MTVGAHAFRRDNRNAQPEFFDTGHYALETHGAKIGANMVELLPPLGLTVSA